jgi:hypothetical protein
MRTLPEIDCLWGLSASDSGCRHMHMPMTPLNDVVMKGPRNICFCQNHAFHETRSCSTPLILNVEWQHGRCRDWCPAGVVGTCEDGAASRASHLLALSYRLTRFGGQPWDAQIYPHGAEAHMARPSRQTSIDLLLKAVDCNVKPRHDGQVKVY